ncbi:MAG: paraquat-inducible protein A [Gloeobacteraceae cyanobacterium ES-bin-144]|nr:paraquat-inducible protein A [Verrucomicrobiales bacterium]
MSAPYPKAADKNLAACHTCGRVSPVSLGHCPRCNSHLYLRKPKSIQTTVALMSAAAALYIPSHLLPIMTVVELGDVTHNTIMGGMMRFWNTGAYPIAIVIFAASILIPFMKIVALSWLCAAATGKVQPSPKVLGKLYWFTELLGRWSMVDIFVVGILVSIVHLGNYMTITPGPGALAFAGVVVLTMLAAMSFEPRLLWDRLDEIPNADPTITPTPKS